ncbi:MAG: hypothetical protein GX643_13055 [Acidimicrobiales bacterium]|nr:hypothetical protein [Acidimicrobiales bacterium]
MPGREDPPKRAGTRAAARLSGLALLAASITVLGACGRNQRTALAIEDVRWHGTAAILLTTECATDLEVEVGPDNSGTGLTEITLWGSPSVGTCESSLSVSIDAGTARIVDGATSMVIDLPDRT